MHRPLFMLMLLATSPALAQTPNPAYKDVQKSDLMLKEIRERQANSLKNTIINTADIPRYLSRAKAEVLALIPTISQTTAQTLVNLAGKRIKVTVYTSQGAYNQKNSYFPQMARYGVNVITLKKVGAGSDFFIDANQLIKVAGKQSNYMTGTEIPTIRATALYGIEMLLKQK
ncbi:hypothetical protein [Deinococcus roseus]|uniref:Uncharacterized protein n=1 Tax=Deinococcus roseus TaxID=392414 RepID=A0ABQ2D6W8_9DEIO|nr:hypothetical protein [Deinococcus roseus]GGJ48115.1 hypothetical protein GCM10008938_37660 [Deinococcus roseus]